MWDSSDLSSIPVESPWTRRVSGLLEYGGLSDPALRHGWHRAISPCGGRGRGRTVRQFLDQPTGRTHLPYPIRREGGESHLVSEVHLRKEGLIQC